MSKQSTVKLLTHLLVILLPSVALANPSAPGQYLQKCGSGANTTQPTQFITDTINGTVTDVKTGLMWKKCGEGYVWDSVTGCSGSSIIGSTPPDVSYTWQTALSQVKGLNSAGGFAGKTDWRIPNIKELASIAELNCNSPAIDLTAFPGPKADGIWMSSSPVAKDSTSIWALSFADGAAIKQTKAVSYQLRLVRNAL